MQDRLEEGLKYLTNTLKKIESLCSWRGLKKAEQRKGHPPSFEINDPTESDIQLEVDFFQKVAFDIKDLLLKLPPREQEELRKRLARLEAKLRAVL